MAGKNYKLDVEIVTESSLDEDIKKMEKLVSLRDKLKTEVDLIPDSAIKELTDLVKKQDEVSESITRQKKRIDDLTKARERLAKSRSAEGKKLAEINSQITEQNKKNREEAKNKLQLASAYDRLSRQLEQNRKKVKDLIASGKELSSADRQLIKDTQALDDKLKKIDRTVGDGRRTVGLYKEGIEEALGSTGRFGSSITQLTAVLTKLKAAQQASIASGSKLGNILKFGTAGLAIGVLGSVIVALTKTQKGIDDVSVLMEGLEAAFDEALGSVGRFGLGVFKVFQGIAEAVSEIKIDFSLDKGLSVSFGKAKEIFAEAATEIGGAFDSLGDRISKAFDLGKTLGRNKLQIREQNLQLRTFLLYVDTALAIQQQISNDVTLDFQKRLDAQRKANKLQEQLSAAEVKIAQNNLKAIRFELKLKQEAGLKDIEFREKELAAKETLAKAESALAIARLNNAQAERQIKLDQLSNELIILEKQFDKISAAREKDFESDRKTIQEKIDLLKDLRRESEKIFNEEIKRISETTGATIDGNDLVSESDAAALRDKIGALKLGDKAADLLNNAIKARQSQVLVENGLTEKTIDLLKKKSQQLKEIGAQTESDVIEGQIIDLENLNKKEDENFKAREDNIKKINELKTKQLEDNAAAEIEAINNSEIEEDLKAAKILAINTKLANDLKKLGIETSNTLADIEKERINKIIKDTDFVVDKLGEALDKRSEKNLDRIDKEAEKQQQAQELQQSRAERGLENELEFQQERAAQLEIERQKEQKKQERRQKILSFYNLLSGYAKEDANTALSKAARDIAISEAISLAFAAEGGVVEDISAKTILNGNQLSRSHSSGDRLVVTSPKEGILTEGQMANLGGKQGFYNLASMLNNPISDDILFPKVPQFASANSGLENGEAIRLLKRLEKAIKDKPVSYSKIDNVGDVITEKTEQGIKHVVKIISRKPRFRR